VVLKDGGSGGRTLQNAKGWGKDHDRVGKPFKDTVPERKQNKGITGAHARHRGRDLGGGGGGTKKKKSVPKKGGGRVVL